jgi:hypothetical protein
MLILNTIILFKWWHKNNGYSSYFTQRAPTQFISCLVTLVKNFLLQRMLGPGPDPKSPGPVKKNQTRAALLVPKMCRVYALNDESIDNN